MPTARSSPLWSDDLEAAVLGAALSNTNAATLVVETCRPDEFYLLINSRVFAKIVELVAAGHSPDYLVVCQALPRADRPHVQALPSRCPAFTNVDLYIERLQRLAALRRLAAVLDRVRYQIDDLAAREVDSR